MTLAEIRRYCAEQQVRLGLHQWKVYLRWMSPVEINEEELHGFVVWSPEEQTAVIGINRKTPLLKDTVRHELLHIRLDGHGPMPGKYCIQKEIVINALTEALK